MTVKHLRSLLADFNDDDRIIIDGCDNFKATRDNEIIYAYKHKKSTDKDYAPVVVLQTRDDFDVKEELEAVLEHRKKLNEDNDKVYLSTLLEMGYKLDDFNYDEARYAWAKRVLEEMENDKT